MCDHVAFPQAAAAAPLWQERRFWYAPAPSRLLKAVAAAARGAAAAFDLRLRQPGLAYLLDHRVRSGMHCHSHRAHGSCLPPFATLTERALCQVQCKLCIVPSAAPLP